MRRTILTSTLLALAAAPFALPPAFAPAPARAQGQSWIDSILPERSYHAGTVARGSKVRHSFPLVNRLNQEVRIATWKTKCGCTEVHPGAMVIPPGSQTYVEAVIDTSRFTGEKRSGLTLVLDRPSYAEVELDFSCYIRGDVMLNPGVVDFGIVPRSTSGKPSIALNLSYGGGRPNWGITRMQTRSHTVSARLNEQSRSANGQVNYLLTATLDPSEVAGFFKDEITLYTNDPTGPTIPIAVSATVQSALTVTPSPLLLGQVKAGQSITKTLLVRASQPFRLTTVKPDHEKLGVKFDAEATAPVHTIALTIPMPAQPGPYNATIEIETDLKGEPPARVTAFANVVP